MEPEDRRCSLYRPGPLLGFINEPVERVECDEAGERRHVDVQPEQPLAPLRRCSSDWFCLLASSGSRCMKT